MRQGGSEKIINWVVEAGAESKELAWTVVTDGTVRGSASGPVRFEDILDRMLHRPLAALLIAALLPLPVSGNQVTLVRVFVGLAGAFLLFLGFFPPGQGSVLVWILAGAALFFSMVLDCADGQLARARGTTSRTGRILDGVADVLVIVPVYAVLSAGIYAQFGGAWFAVAAVAGFSMWIHAVVFDKVKLLILAQAGANPVGTGPESIETVRAQRDEARLRGGSLDGLLLSVYLVYLTVQARLTPGRHVDKTPTEWTPRGRRNLMGLSGFMGLGTHVFLLYVGVALMALDVRSILVVQVLFATVFNVLMLVVFLGTRSAQAT